MTTIYTTEPRPLTYAERETLARILMRQVRVGSTGLLLDRPDLARAVIREHGRPEDQPEGNR